MLHRTLAALTLAAGLWPATVTAGPQLDWARHGFAHGAWDCGGDCPSGRPHPSRSAEGPAPRRQAHRAAFDGTWSVSAAGPCLGAGTSQVLISGGRIMGQNGGGGHVSPDGAIDTIGNVDGITVVGEGQIFGRTASGIYRQSDGCSSSWSAVKL